MSILRQHDEFLKNYYYIFPYQYVTIFVWFTSIKRDVSSKEMKHLKNIASIQPCLLSDVYLEEFKWSLRRANMHQLWSMSVLFAKRLLLIQNFREVKDKSETYFHASNVSQSWSQTWEDQHGGGDTGQVHVLSCAFAAKNSINKRECTTPKHYMKCGKGSKL